MMGMLLALMMLLAGFGAPAEQENGGNVVVNRAVVGEIEMDYAVFGQGERALVILPGLSLKPVTPSADAVAAAYAAFAQNYRVYLFDRRNSIEAGYSVRQMAADTAAVMRDLGIADACVFGASQGGMMAQYLAIDFPELVGALALGSTLPQANETSRKVIGNWVKLARAGDAQLLAKDMLEKIYAPTTIEAYGEALLDGYADTTPEEMEKFAILASACADFDCTAELSKIACPTLVIGCEGDQVVTAEGSRQIQRALDCESYFYGAEYGHGVYDEAPDYVSRLYDFFKKY